MDNDLPERARSIVGQPAWFTERGSKQRRLFEYVRRDQNSTGDVFRTLPGDGPTIVVSFDVSAAKLPYWVDWVIDEADRQRFVVLLGLAMQPRPVVLGVVRKRL